MKHCSPKNGNIKIFVEQNLNKKEQLKKIANFMCNREQLLHKLSLNRSADKDEISCFSCNNYLNQWRPKGGWGKRDDGPGHLRQGGIQRVKLQKCKCWN